MGHASSTRIDFRAVRIRRILLVVLVVVAALLAAGGTAFYWLQSSGRPLRGGIAHLPDLGGEVTVRFDRWGVPTIEAGSTADAMAALGWLHANDRLFQMEITRRAATGRLAELFGERALAYDRRIRRLDMLRFGERLLDDARPETRALLDAYARGVNAWIEERGDDLPPEFKLLGRRPEPWRPEDSLGVLAVMARTLSPVVNPPENELFELLHAFGPERARELAIDPEARIFDEVAEIARDTAPEPRPVGARAEGSGLGSNNWAVAPERSADGHALLANDPHLGLRLPSVWFEAQIIAPDYQAAGMTFPGAPAVILGRGPKIAWACTNLYIDDVDVFLERVDDSGTRVRRGDAWVPLDVERQEISVAGRRVAVDVKRSDRGVFLDADRERGLPPRSIAWTGWYAADQLAAFLALPRTERIEDVPARIASFAYPAQNLVAASADGQILWTPIGQGPERFGWDGRFPAPAWRSDVGWSGLHPADDNPVLLDPPSGLIGTANSRLPMARPEWFGEDFDTPYRVDRIEELLAGRSDWTVDRLLAMQTDDVSLWARELVAAIPSGLDGEAARAAGALRAWDGTMAPSGPSALFALFERALQRDVFEDEAKQADVPRFGTRKRLAALVEGRIPAVWFDDVSTPRTETREEIFARALAEAWRDGVSRWGETVAAWSYAGMHQLELGHTLDNIPLLGRWFSRGPFALPGSSTTILAFGGPWRDDRIEVAYGPSMRFVTDAAEPVHSVAVLPGGESGHPGDPHYADQIADYLAGRAHPVPWGKEAADASAVSTLLLVPGTPLRSQ